MLINSTTEPVLIDCPKCGKDGALHMPTTGDFADIKCPACGDYEISGTAYEILEGRPEGARGGYFRMTAVGKRRLEA